LINPKDGKKNCPENSYCRVVFETDVENEFLDRPNDPGELRISNDSLIKSKRLRNGKLTLTVDPELISLKEGDKITIDVELDSFGAAPTFAESFILNITEIRISLNLSFMFSFSLNKYTYIIYYISSAISCTVFRVFKMYSCRQIWHEFCFFDKNHYREDVPQGRYYVASNEYYIK
jgi:hypothetical protein